MLRPIARIPVRRLLGLVSQVVIYLMTPFLTIGGKQSA